MKFIELSKKYEQLFKSNIRIDKLKADGLLDIITDFNNSKKDEIFEEVKISLIAEDLYNRMIELYKPTKNDIYRFKAVAAMDCIIKYATQQDIIKEMKNFKNGDIHNFDDWVNFIKRSKINGRVKKADLLSVFNLNNL